MAERTYRFTVLISPKQAAGRYSVTVPALSGCVGEGNTQQEAIAAVKLSIRRYIADLLQRGEPVPPDVVVFTVEVDVPEA